MKRYFGLRCETPKAQIIDEHENGQIDATEEVVQVVVEASQLVVLSVHLLV